MDLAVAVAGILGGIAALFGIGSALAAAWRWRKQRGQSSAPTTVSDPPGAEAAPPSPPGSNTISDPASPGTPLPAGTAAPGPGGTHTQPSGSPFHAPSAVSPPHFATPATVHPNHAVRDVFLSYSHDDAKLAKALATRLSASGFSVWFDKWSLVPGTSWQQGMAEGLKKAKSCGICIGSRVPEGWFQQEIQRALNRQSQDTSFRVIPILLPGADPVSVDDFLELRTWVDFRRGMNDAEAFHILRCGILGVPPEQGPEQDPVAKTGPSRKAIRGLARLRRLYDEKLIHEDTWIEKQRLLVDIVIESEDDDAPV